MAENVLVVHGGGPTAVINSSLYGVLEEAKASGKIDKVYGAMGGSEAIFKERFFDLLQFPEEKLKLLLETPATAIGSSRYAMEEEDYKAMPEIFKKYDIKMCIRDRDLFRWVKENNYKTCCVFLTSHAEFGYAKEAIRLGAFDYIDVYKRQVRISF